MSAGRAAEMKMPPGITKYATDPVGFIDQYIRVGETGQPFRLLPHQRDILGQAFQFDSDGRLAWDTFIYSATKKSGKTAINAALTCWWAYTQEAPNELYVLANDQEQAQSRVFATLAKFIKRNPALARSAVVETSRIVLANGTEIRALASDYAGAAGSNHGLTSWDELWAYTSESARRLWDELTPVPTRRNSIRLITSYAGFEAESALLYGLYKSGVGPDEVADGQGTLVHATLPLYFNAEARLIVYWDHEPRMPWQTESYLTAQKRTLRASAYTRLHDNRWTTGESTFITPELWGACVDPDHRPALPDRAAPALFVGVDAGIKHDNAAVVAVRWHAGKLELAGHKIWRPTPQDPIDLEATVEAHLRDLHRGYQVKKMLCDPYQLHRSISTLTAAHLPIEEFAQTTQGTTRMGEALLGLLNGRNLRLYPSDELRQQAMNTVAVESTRGWRISKEKSSRKIDSTIALSLACVAALEHGPSTSGFVVDAVSAKARVSPETMTRLSRFRDPDRDSPGWWRERPVRDPRVSSEGWGVGRFR